MATLFSRILHFDFSMNSVGFIPCALNGLPTGMQAQSRSQNHDGDVALLNHGAGPIDHSDGEHVQPAQRRGRVSRRKTRSETYAASSTRTCPHHITIVEGGNDPLWC